MGRSIDNISSDTTMNLASGTGISIQGNEIAVDPTTVTLDTETQQLQAQVTAIQSTANLANSKAELLASAQYGLIENVAIANNNINVANNNINFLLPYFDTTYTTIVNSVQVQSRDAQPIWHDRDLRWTNTKTNQSNLELPNGMYECKFRTLGNSSGGMLAAENHRLWQFFGMFNWIKLDAIFDEDAVPRILEPVSYYHTQNHLSTEADMKISIVRVAPLANYPIKEWRAFFKFGDSIPANYETTIKLEFTMRKVFDT
jgi:hypothetical protein